MRVPGGALLCPALGQAGWAPLGCLHPGTCPGLAAREGTYSNSVRASAGVCEQLSRAAHQQRALWSA